MIRCLMTAALVCHFTISAGAGVFPWERVRAWEGTITLPTYELPEQDPNPAFAAFSNRNDFYPYSQQDLLAVEKHPVTHKAAFLENDYIKVTCLPDLGGRIYSVYDKTIDAEMFYTNEVIKPALIGMRGAWYSGGIDWNSGPRGHGVTSYDAVNVSVCENKDGSATMFIGNTDMTSRTEWLVKLTVHPGRSYLDEEISIYNPTDGVHTYYFWNNTAFPEEEGTRFVFPMNLGTDHHGREFFDWPINKGRDITWLKNHRDPTSIFAYKCIYDFFGGYNAVKDQGVAMYGSHHSIVGKKAWTWGQTERGYRRQAGLADDGTRYIEIQSGPLPTQSDLGLLGPGESRRWQEWWYPVHGLKDGFEYATRDMAIQTHRDGEELEIRAIGTGEFNARCKVTCGDRTLLDEKVDVDPEEAIILAMQVPGGDPVDISFTDRDGEILAEYTSPLPMPDVAPPTGKPELGDTTESFYLKGLDAEKHLNTPLARSNYSQAVQKDAHHTRSLTARGVLDLEQGRTGPAIASFEKALERDAHAGKAWYFLGTAQLLENWLAAKSASDFASGLSDALESAHMAAQENGTAAIGHDLIGRVYMRQGRYAEALASFERARERMTGDDRVLMHLALAAYEAGEMDDAVDTAEMILDSDPFTLPASYLLVMAGEKEKADFVEDAVDYLGRDALMLEEAALQLASLGMIGAARDMLSAFLQSDPELALRPMPHYYIRYFDALLGEDSGEAERWASITPDDEHVFPFRPEELSILRYAVASDPGDADARLYLGNLYAGLFQVDQAASEWKTALEQDGSLSVAARNLGQYHWKVKNDLDAAEAYYRIALAARPSDQTLYRDTGQILLAMDDREGAIAVLSAMPKDAAQRSDAVFLLAEAHMKQEQYDDVLAVLTNRKLNTWEAQSKPHDIYARALLERGKKHLAANQFESALEDFNASRLYPENLGVGRPENPEEAESYYLAGQALEKLGRTDDAKAAYRTAVEASDGSANQNDYKKRAQEALAKLG